jgi:class 3 adenylate cyclase
VLAAASPNQVAPLPSKETGMGHSGQASVNQLIVTARPSLAHRFQLKRESNPAASVVRSQSHKALNSVVENAASLSHRSAPEASINPRHPYVLPTTQCTSNASVTSPDTLPLMQPTSTGSSVSPIASPMMLPTSTATVTSAVPLPDYKDASTRAQLEAIPDHVAHSTPPTAAMCEVLPAQRATVPAKAAHEVPESVPEDPDQALPQVCLLGTGLSRVSPTNDCHAGHQRIEQVAGNGALPPQSVLSEGETRCLPQSDTASAGLAVDPGPHEMDSCAAPDRGSLYDIAEAASVVEFVSEALQPEPCITAVKSSQESASLIDSASAVSQASGAQGIGALEKLAGDKSSVPLVSREQAHELQHNRTFDRIRCLVEELPTQSNHVASSTALATPEQHFPTNNRITRMKTGDWEQHDRSPASSTSVSSVCEDRQRCTHTTDMDDRNGTGSSDYSAQGSMDLSIPASLVLPSRLLPLGKVERYRRGTSNSDSQSSSSDSSHLGSVRCSSQPAGFVPMSTPHGDPAEVHEASADLWAQWSNGVAALPITDGAHGLLAPTIEDLANSRPTSVQGELEPRSTVPIPAPVSEAAEVSPDVAAQEPRATAFSVLGSMLSKFRTHTVHSVAAQPTNAGTATTGNVLKSVSAVNTAVNVAKAVKAEQHRLSLKILCGAGTMAVYHCGGTINKAGDNQQHDDKLARWEYFLGDSAHAPAQDESGQRQAITQIAAIEEHAMPGDIIISSEMLDAIGAENATANTLAGGAARLHDVKSDGDQRSKLCFQENSAQQLPSHVAARAAALFRMHVIDNVRQRIEAGHYDFIDEIRQLTILFMGFPTLSKPNQSLAHRLEPVQDTVLAVNMVMQQYRGTFVQFRCDEKGFLAICAFGLPGVTHANNPERGILAALKMQMLVESKGQQFACGVTTGPLLCACVGSKARSEYTMFGDAINLAARLMCKAKGGLGVVISDEPTSQKADTKALYEPLEPLMLKGKASPTRVWLSH